MSKKKSKSRNKKKLNNQPIKGKTIKCRTCGKQVSAKASRCPHCGTQLRLSNASLIFLIAFIIVIVISAIIVLTGH